MTAASVGILIEERKLGTIARVTIENSAKLNTLDSHLMIALIGELEALAGRDDLRAVVLTGAGTKAFIGGANIFEMATLDAEKAEAFIAAAVHQRDEGFGLFGVERRHLEDVRAADESLVTSSGQ